VSGGIWWQRPAGTVVGCTERREVVDNRGT
jgi:hypothetical protein